jgi:hypothetical protein
MAKRSEEICESFQQTRWHDSKLLGLHLISNPESIQYDLRLDIDLIVGFVAGKIERRKSIALFSDCRILQADLDLLGISMCSRDIGAAVVIQTRPHWRKGREIRFGYSIPRRMETHCKNALAFFFDGSSRW